MPKRTTWTVVGYTAGLASSLYVQRKVRRTVQRYAPPEVRRTVADAGSRAWRAGAEGGVAVAAAGAGAARRAHQLVADVRAAVVDGRAAMAETEQSLAAEYAPRRR